MKDNKEHLIQERIKYLRENTDITDAIILLRYVEMYGEMRRGLTVLKMRGSMHDKEIREFAIDDKGMYIGKPFRVTV